MPTDQTGSTFDYTYVDPNIFVSDISVSFGYAVNKVKESTLYLFSQNSKTYLVNDFEYPKVLEARFVYVDKEGEIPPFAVNNKAKLEEYIEREETFRALNPSLHWYRFVREEGVSDEVAGDFWQEITDNINEFTLSVNDLKDIEDERFKCVMWYRPQHEEDEDSSAKKWALQDENISSEVLIFTNQDSPYDSARDLDQALRLNPKGAPNGVFNLYEASFGANNSLINSADSEIPRYINATFFTCISKEHKMDDVTRLAWYIPKEHTMITKPAEGRGFDSSNQRFLTSIAEIAAFKNDNTIFNDENGYLSEEEEALFKERINDYYIIVNYDVKKQIENQSDKTTIALTYYIEPVLIKHWTNNTIYASAYYHQRNYQGNNAKCELTFGTKGNNGTNYTLQLCMLNETVKDGNDTVYEHPSA